MSGAIIWDFLLSILTTIGVVVALCVNFMQFRSRRDKKNKELIELQSSMEWLKECAEKNRRKFEGLDQKVNGMDNRLTVLESVIIQLNKQIDRLDE